MSDDRSSAKPTLLEPVATIDHDGDGGPQRYAGGKNGAGIWQRIISQMPPHEVYIEAFVGSGAVLSRKRPARVNVAYDVDPKVIHQHVLAQSRRGVRSGPGYVNFHIRDAVTALWSHPHDKQTLVYADPPYLGSSRALPKRDCYTHEMKGDEEHAELLRILTTIPAMVMISGYRCALYDHMLRDWRRLDYQARTRGATMNESLWMNFPEPTELHDYRYLGKDFHDRCRIKRRIERLRRRLAGLPALERNAVISAITSSSSAEIGVGAAAND